jgi:membrane fusion protein (multidrug efflux system)
MRHLTLKRHLEILKTKLKQYKLYNNMKYSLYLLLATVMLAACGGGDKPGNKDAQLAKLKKDRSEIDVKIQKLEAENGKGKPRKATSVSIVELQPQKFNAFVEVQSQISGDENVNAMPQAPGTVTNILVKVGQKVSKGQTLATLDASNVDQQIQGQDVQVILTKQLYEKQQKLWAQNIGTEVQLLQAKANYEGAQKQKAALVAQRSMSTIKSPISGIVDEVSLKIGDMAGGGSTNHIRVVNFDKLKAEANLGENYLGKVQQNDPVTIVLPDLNDSIQTKLTYVSQAVDPISRAFLVQVRLGSNKKLHPNMSCRMKIANYEASNALVVPVSVIQKTSDGDMLYIADGNKAKSVIVKPGRNSNGMVEILSGLNPGDRVITEGYEELDNGELIEVKAL